MGNSHGAVLEYPATWSDKREAARSSDTHPKIFIRLAREANWNIRVDLAGNSSIPEEASDILARDEIVGVRVKLAYVSVSSRILDVLSWDEDSDVQLGVALNSRTSSGALMGLLDSENYDVREAAERNFVQRGG